MNSPSLLRTVLAIGLPLATIATIILAISYVNDQQIIRMSANEPQEWLARGLAARLEGGVQMKNAYLWDSVTVMSDPTPYVIVYDRYGSTTAATASFGNKVTHLPQGVLEYAKLHGVNRLTWEPAKDLREAIVVVPINGGEGGYVLAGRSLAYAEEQEAQLAQRAFFGWLVSMIAILAVSLISALLLRKRSE